MSETVNRALSPMRVGVAGWYGRMGSLVAGEIRSGVWLGTVLTAGRIGPTDPQPTNAQDDSLGTGKEASVFMTSDAQALFEKSDVVIDFTTPQATGEHVRVAARTGRPLVIGTTGLSAEEENDIRAAARDTAIVYAANMSAGVTLLSALVEKAAAALKDGWDIEIFEAHHRAKVDAPSGTAFALGRAAAKARQTPDAPPPPFSFARHGAMGPRPAEPIGFSVARGGDVVGDHTVFFYGAGERLELTHRATDRALFARGAIRAALWLRNRPPGLYSMRDVLGLS